MDAREDMRSYIASIFSQMSNRPHRTLYEDWGSLAIDAAVWTATNPGAGVNWAVASTPILWASCAPNALNNCRMRSNAVWFQPGGIAFDIENYVNKKLIVEFELYVDGNWTRLVNTTTFFGLSTTVGAIRTTNNIMGFGITGAGNDLQLVCDKGGSEDTYTTVFTPGAMGGLWNKYRIEIYDYGQNSPMVTFFFNERNLYTCDDWNDIPGGGMYLNFYADVGAAGAVQLALGAIRAWYEDERYFKPW
jgi:hypothetical protein